MKIRPVTVDGWTDGQADMTKLIVTSHNFAKVPKNHKKSHELGLIRPRT